MNTKKLLKTLSNKSYILVPHIENYLSQGNFPDVWNITISNRREADEYFHPSTDCLTPAKELFLIKTGKSSPDKISSSLRMTFDFGTLVHGYIENIMVDMGFVSSGNVERHHTQKIVTKRGGCTARGTGDLVDMEIPGHGKWLVDIKTMNRRNFDSPNQYLMQKYVAQVNVYSDFFNLDNIMILAICKDNGEMREIIVQKDQNLIDDIYDRWSYVAQCIRSNTVPE